MTKLFTLGASLLVLSLAAPAWAEDPKAPPAKPETPKPTTFKAGAPDDRAARHAEDGARADREDRDDKHDKHDKARRHDRD